MSRLAVMLVVCACGGSTTKMTMTDAAIDSRPPGMLVAYVAGYGPDIAWSSVSRATGALTPVGSVPAFAANPSFLAVAPNATALYAVSEGNDRVGAYAIDAATGALAFIDDVASAGSGPAHVAVDRTGKFVFVANYGDGGIAVLPIRADHGVGDALQPIHAGANAHMMVSDPSNRYVFVPCLGSDYVAQYVFDAATGALAPNPVPHLATAAGAGPRHLAFAPDGVHAYLVNEKASTLTALALDPSTGQLAALQTVSMRAAGATGANTGAEVWVHPNGRFVFASNRGDDTIVTFSIDATGRVAQLGQTATQGQTPRDFTLDASGAFLYVANQNSGTVVQLSIDPATGALASTGAQIAAVSPSFVGIVELP